MADSTSHSLFISIRYAVGTAKRIFNQHAKHASSLQRNFRIREALKARRLFFMPARVPFT
ncbi:MAG: hypothetical protein DME96_01030 [Verrucomicrobia bacterium]|nr:MAG: hypothetical protein DME96_01030 [Verrucomicrobiota bacterium]